MDFKIAELKKDDILTEALDGLTKKNKELPSKLFYDEKGSALFDEICLQEEYYPTRTEIGIMKENINSIAETLGEGIMLVELGSGSSVKTRLLLDNLKNLNGYIPIDISADYLFDVADDLKMQYPGMNIYPLAADYTKDFDLPLPDNHFQKIVFYFPGSTIGNFTPDRARKFLKRISKKLNKNDGLLIGFDLKKDKTVLENAYNDKAGITADFNLNILERLNKEINADFDLDKFQHRAFYNDKEGRIEMHLVCKEISTVKIGGINIYFGKGEDILTEYSYKYSPDKFIDLVSDSFEVKKIWTDNDGFFSVQYLEVKQEL